MILSTQIAHVAKRIGYIRAAKYTKSAGFDAVDYDYSDYASWAYCARGEGDSLFSLDDELVAAFFRDAYREMRAEGVYVGQTHAPFPSSRVNGAEVTVTSENLRLARLSLRLTREMNCDYCVIHPVFSGYCDYDRDPEKQKLYRKLNMDFYGALIEDAKKYEVKICLENMWGSLGGGIILPAVLSHPAELCEWIDELNEKAGEEVFCACLDTGHACLTGDDPAEAIRLLGHRLQRLHMHDVRKNSDAHTLPFTGICDWTSLAAALKEIGYTGTLNFETGGFQEHMPDALLRSATLMLGQAAGHIRNLVMRK